MASTSSPVAAAGATPSSATGSPATEGVLPTVTNFQATAGQNIANAGATALAQIAAAGSKGQAAIQQAQAQNAAAKTAAIQSAMATSALHGGGQQFGQNTAMLATTPLTSAAGTLSNLGANYAAENQGLQAANSNYFAGLQGALPIDAAAIQQDILNDQSKNASAATSANLSLDEKELALQAAQAKANPSSPVAPGLGALGLNATDAQKIDALGGAQQAGQLFNQDATQAENPLGGQIGPPVASLAGANALAPQGAGYGSNVSPQAQAQAYAQIDQQYGLPPGTSQALAAQAEAASRAKQVTASKSGAPAPAGYTPPAPAAPAAPKITAADIAATSKAPNYAATLKATAAAIAAGTTTKDAAAATLVAQYGWTPVEAAIIADQADGIQP